ncbi:MAG: sulfotransferase family protein [Gordonia sp. (in: high G+C Gram-positive bacteria)]
MSVVYVHVGLPKTGTTHVQDRLWLNRDLAARHGDLLYPGNWMEDHFHAATHLNPERYLDWADPAHADAWPTMVAQMKTWPGKSLVSHELFANAGPSHIQKLVADLDFADEVHVVLTVRDLARQLPSVWQENVKNQRPTSFADFVSAVAADTRDGAHAGDLAHEPFWEFQDYPAIVAKWSAVVPAERIHVVTVPEPGSATPGDGLWERFLGVLGVDPAVLTVPAVSANTSLSAAQAEFLRLLNLRIQPDDIEWQRYERIVKQQLVGEVLFSLREGKPLGLDAEQRAWAAELSDGMVEAVVAGGYPVHGSLDDVRVAVGEVGDARVPSADETLDAALDALACWIKAMPVPKERMAARTRAANLVRRARRRAVGMRGRLTS